MDNDYLYAFNSVGAGLSIFIARMYHCAAVYFISAIFLLALCTMGLLDYLHPYDGLISIIEDENGKEIYKMVVTIPIDEIPRRNTLKFKFVSSAKNTQP